MDEAAVALLKAQLEERTGDIDRLFARIDERQTDFRATADGVDSMAYRLHNLYGAFEQLFQEIAAAFENQIEPGRFHAGLLRRMKLEIEGVRPALLSTPTFEGLDELRRFRHFFRHAYTADLDPDKVTQLVGKALDLRSGFDADVRQFLGRLAP